jgi:hypothetical protein
MVDTANWGAKFKEATKGALISGADIAILEAANKADIERDKQYTEIEASAKSAALKRYKEQQVDSRLVKAALIPRTGEDASIKIINFMFNPTDLSLSRSVSITPMNGARTQRGLPKVNFGFVEPYKLTLAGILFDTYETGKSVFDKIQPLLNAVDFSKFKDPFKKQESGKNSYQERVVKVSIGQAAIGSFVENIGGKNVLGVQEYDSENIGKQSLEIRRPPVFYFIWGEKNYMCCMVKQLDYKLTMFLPNGTPVRAMVNITLEEVDLGVASRAFSQRQKYISD